MTLAQANNNTQWHSILEVAESSSAQLKPIESMSKAGGYSRAAP